MRKILKHKAFHHATLFSGMYLITATMIAAETGSPLIGMTVGLLGTIIKTGWHHLHSFLLNISHDDGTESTLKINFDDVTSA